MKSRFILFRRVEVFYCEDTTTRKQTSLRTKIESEALTILRTKNEAVASEVQEETAKHFEQAQPEQKQRTLEETAGIPTGLAPDIEKQVALGKAKRVKAPDNIVLDSPPTAA